MTSQSTDDKIGAFCRLLAQRYRCEGVARATVTGSSLYWEVARGPEDSHGIPSTAGGAPADCVAWVDLGESKPQPWVADMVRDVVCAAPGCVVTADGRAAGVGGGTLDAWLEADAGVHPDFTGAVHGGGRAKPRAIAILPNSGVVDDGEPPPDFSVVAFITAFNEEDIILATIRHLARQEVGVVLVDNWSTDATVERASEMLGNGLLRIETYPASGPSKSFDWADLLRHVTELSGEVDAHWFIHHDADEIRRSPWPGRSLKSALHVADQRGFTAINYTQLDFQPVDNGFRFPMDPESYFQHYIVPKTTSPEYRVNTWKNLSRPVDLASSGGHHVTFEGLRLFPYNFLLKHYSIRSQAHGERKVFADRQARWNRADRAQQWHFHYDHVRAGHNFVRKPGDLSRLDDDFEQSLLVERLSCVGLQRIPRRYAWRSRRVTLDALRRAKLLRTALRIQRWILVRLRKEVSSGSS